MSSLASAADALTTPDAAEKSPSLTVAMPRDRAIAALQDAADHGHADAAAMLASLLGQQRPARPATGRDVPPLRHDPPAQAPGYHCHKLAFGAMWCHAGADQAGY